MPETTTGKELEFSQPQVNTLSTTIQQPENVELRENVQTVDEAKDAEIRQVSQHTTNDEGERGGVKQTQSGGVLQTVSRPKSSAIAHRKIPIKLIVVKKTV
jgi:hypothetical protein